MNPKNFPGCNVCYGKDQDLYPQVPGNFNKQTGFLITKWELSDEEVAEIVRNKCMFIGIATYGKPLQPFIPTVYQMFHPGEEPKPEETVNGKELEIEEGQITLCQTCPDREDCVKNGCKNKR